MQQHALRSLRNASNTFPAKRGGNAALLDCVSPFSLERVATRWIAQLTRASRNLQKSKEKTVLLRDTEAATLSASNLFSSDIGATSSQSASLTEKASEAHPTISISPLESRPTSSESLDARQKQLYLYLRKSTSDEVYPPPTIRDLREFHDAIPILRTSQSYNLLIGYAIRQGAYRIAERIFQEMEEASCSPNTYTWRLKIRLHLAQGHPELAYQCAAEGLTFGPFSAERRSEPVPFSVWAQLLRPGGRQRQYGAWPSAARPPTSKLRQRDDVDAPESLPLDNPHNIPLHLMFAPGFFPEVASFGDLDYRTTGDVVAFLRSHGKTDVATEVTLNWISCLPQSLSAEDNARAFHIINRNLHDHTLSSPRTKGSKLIKKMVRDQLKLIREAHTLRPKLRPTILSIHQILRATRLMRNPATEVQAVMVLLETLWPNVLDFVGRTLALSAILKDEVPYRCRELVESLVWEQDHELAIRKLRRESGQSSGEVEVDRLRGQDVAKYFSTKAKARRLGVLNDAALGRIDAKLEGIRESTEVEGSNISDIREGSD